MATPEQLAAALERVNAQLQSAEQRLKTMEAEKTVIAAEVAALRDDKAAGPVAKQRATKLLDTRVLGKPQAFDGDTARYSDWSFVLKSYMSAVDPAYTEAFREIEASEVSMVNATLSADDVDLSTQLYYVLVMLTSGPALTKVYNAGVSEGFEAWRQFALEWEPRLASRHVGLLMRIMSFPFEGEVPAKISQFERLVNTYESQSKKKIEDDTKIGLVTLNMRDAALKEHLVKNANRLATWALVVAEINEICRTQQFLQSTPQPMDLGAFPQGQAKGGGRRGRGGRGRGQSQGRGRGKGGGKGAAGQQGGSNAEKTCFYCKKKGHVKADCRKRQRDLANAEAGRRPVGATPLGAATPAQGSQPLQQQQPTLTYYQTASLPTQPVLTQPPYLGSGAFPGGATGSQVVPMGALPAGSPAMAATYSGAMGYAPVPPPPPPEPGFLLALPAQETDHGDEPADAGSPASSEGHLSSDQDEPAAAGSTAGSESHPSSDQRLLLAATSAGAGSAASSFDAVDPTPLCSTGVRRRLMIDNCAGASVFPAGFDSSAQDDPTVSGVTLMTATGQPVTARSGKRSNFRVRNGTTVTVRYNEAPEVRFPIVSVAEATAQGNWFVFGPGVQMMTANLDPQVARALRQQGGIELTKDRGVYWLDCEDASPAAGDTALPLCPTRVVRKAVPAEAAPQSAEPDAQRAGDPAEAQGQQASGAAQATEAVREVENPASLPSGEVQRPTRAKRLPPLVDEREYDLHMITHQPFRSWCPHCVAGKATEDDHSRRSDAAEGVPRWGMDYFFLGRGGETPAGSSAPAAPPTQVTAAGPAENPEARARPVLNNLDARSGAVFPACTAKGGTEYALAVVMEATKFTGRGELLMLVDQEASAKLLADEVRARRAHNTVVLHTPRGSSASAGGIERANREVADQARTLRSRTEEVYGIRVDTYHKLVPWLVRHAGWLITHFQVKSDGKTPFERLRRRPYHGEVVEFAETVHYKEPPREPNSNKFDDRWFVGIWLGKSLASDEHYVGTPRGVARCRSVWRRPGPKRWQLTALEAYQGMPWDPQPAAARGAAGAGAPRGVYITLDRQVEHGGTPGCPACFGHAKVHSAECRERFGKILRPQAEEAAASGGPETQQAAGGLAPQQASGAPSSTPGAGSPADRSMPMETEAGAVVGGARRPREESGTGASSSSSGAQLVPVDAAAGSPAGGEQPYKKSKIVAGLPTLHEPDTVAAPSGGAVGYLCGGPQVIERVAPQTALHGDAAGTAAGSSAGSEGYPSGDQRLHSGGVSRGLDAGSTAVKIEVSDRTVYGTKSGEPLDPLKVREGRQREMDNIEKFDVRKVIPLAEARQRGLKLVHAKWLDDVKPTPQDPHAVRSRLVATEVNTYVREDVTQATPPLKCARLIVSLAASKTQRGQTRLIGRYDVRVAFFHAPSTGKIAVLPPRDLVPGGHCWWLNKAMYGTREASQCWGQQVIKVCVQNQYKECLVVPMTFYHSGHDTTVNCHGDDFLAEAEASGLDALDKVLSENFDVKILPRIGPPNAGGQTTSGKHLGRTIRWTPRGFEWDGAQCHVTELISLMGLRDTAAGRTAASKGASTPGSKDTGKAMRNASDKLTEEKAATFRKAAGTALYISLDRPTILFATHEVMSGMAEPTELHWAKLHRLARYLLQYPEETWLYDYQELPSKLEVLADSDWAGDRETRKSVSCLAERFGGHLLEVSVAKQTVVALSSGEAEFYAIVRAVATGLQTKQLLETCGLALELDALSDSSAGRAVCTRTGSGKIRHLELKELWIQQTYREKKFGLGVVDTLLNWADIGTKALEKERLDSLVKQMPLRREGRNTAASTALAVLLLAQTFLAADTTAVGPFELGCASTESGEPHPWCSTVLVGFTAYFLALHVLLGCCAASCWNRGLLRRRPVTATQGRLPTWRDRPETGHETDSPGEATPDRPPSPVTLRRRQRVAPQGMSGTRTDSRGSEALTGSSDSESSSSAADHPVAGSSAVAHREDGDLTAIKRLLTGFTVDELRRELRERRMSAAGTKQAMITRIMGATPLATERQALYIESLMRQARIDVREGRLAQPPTLKVEDLGSTHLASRWLDRWKSIGFRHRPSREAPQRRRP